MAIDAVFADYAPPTVSSQRGAGSISEVQDRFLKLLVTQLQNQDPMNPMENAELTTQLAQMSTVEGINNLNSSLDALLTSYRSSQNLQAAALIGHSVMVPSTSLSLTAGGAIGGMDLAAPADSVTLTLLDATGAVVQSIALGPHDAGFSPFRWEGTDAAGNALAPGLYRFALEAKAGGEAVGVQALAAGRVASVMLAGNEVLLDTEGMGTYSFSQVKQIF